MAFCPKCQSPDYREHKSWDVKPHSGKKEIVRVTVVSCRSCGNKFRVANKVTSSHIAHNTHGLQKHGITAPTPKLNVENHYPPTSQPTTSLVPSETSSDSVQDSNTTTPMPLRESLIHRLWIRLHGFL